MVRDVEDDTIVGVMLFTYTEPWWDTTGYLTNAVMFVEKEYRDLRTLKSLLEAGHKYAKIVGKEFAPSFSFIEGLDRVNNMMDRLGYSQKMSVFGK